MPDPGAYGLPLGQHKGRTLDDVSTTTEGLKYLDWLLGQEWVRDPLRAALVAFLEQDDVKAELEELLDQED